MRRIARTAVFNDLSGLGRCALAVQIPLISALGVQACPVPTALLSAHTGFPGARIAPQGDFLRSAIAHFSELGAGFDGVLSGYLGDVAQAESIRDFMNDQRAMGCAVTVVDPVMADHGRLYAGISPEMPRAMARLCRDAALITPNPTEARLLLGEAPCDSPLSPDLAGRLVRALLDLGCQSALVTGVRLLDGRCVNALATAKKTLFCFYVPLPASYPGTGDLFSAAMAALLLEEASPAQALGRATAIVYRVMEESLQRETPPREGVALESALGALSEIAGFDVREEESF